MGHQNSERVGMKIAKLKYHRWDAMKAIHLKCEDLRGFWNVFNGWHPHYHHLDSMYGSEFHVEEVWDILGALSRSEVLQKLRWNQE